MTDQFWTLPEETFEELEKGYGLGAYYSRELIQPTAKVLRAGAGKLKPVLPQATKVEPKHKRVMQRGF